METATRRDTALTYPRTLRRRDLLNFLSLDRHHQCNRNRSPILLARNGVTFVAIVDSDSRVYYVYPLRVSASIFSTYEHLQAIPLLAASPEHHLYNLYNSGPSYYLLDMPIEVLQHRKCYNAEILSAFKRRFKRLRGRRPHRYEWEASVEAIFQCNKKIEEAIDLLAKVEFSILDLASMSSAGLRNAELRIETFSKTYKARCKARYVKRVCERHFVKLQLVKIREYTLMFGSAYDLDERFGWSYLWKPLLQNYALATAAVAQYDVLVTHSLCDTALEAEDDEAKGEKQRAGQIGVKWVQAR